MLTVECKERKSESVREKVQVNKGKMKSQSMQQKLDGIKQGEWILIWDYSVPSAGLSWDQACTETGITKDGYKSFSNVNRELILTESYLEHKHIVRTKN